MVITRYDADFVAIAVAVNIPFAILLMNDLWQRKLLNQLVSDLRPTSSMKYSEST